MIQPVWKGRLAVSYKGKYTFTYDPVISLLSIYLREMKIYIHIKTYKNAHSYCIYNS